jgi:hypothetical protein
MALLSTLRMSTLSLDQGKIGRGKEKIQGMRSSHWRFPLIDSRSIGCSNPFVRSLMNSVYLEQKDNDSIEDPRIKWSVVLVMLVFYASVY